MDWERFATTMGRIISNDSLAVASSIAYRNVIHAFRDEFVLLHGIESWPGDDLFYAKCDPTNKLRLN